MCKEPNCLEQELLGKTVVGGWNSCGEVGMETSAQSPGAVSELRFFSVSLSFYTAAIWLFGGFTNTVQFFSVFFPAVRNPDSDFWLLYLQVQFYGINLMNLEQSEVRLGKALSHRNLLSLSSAVLLAHTHKPWVLHIQDIRVAASVDIQAAIITLSAFIVSLYAVLFKYLDIYCLNNLIFASSIC